jgi:general stress protein 26
VGGLTEQLRELLDAHRVGVLATVTEDGKPRQSVVYYVRDEARLLISTLSKRLKARDVGRTAWASLSVRGGRAALPVGDLFGGRRRS